jgi:hypothetical protein
MTPEEFFGAVANMPEPQQLFYRLYHNEHGAPLFYSMEQVPGTYIDIDQVAFAAGAMNVRVINHKLQEYNAVISTKLVPSSNGTQCHEHDVAVVVMQNGTYWNKQTYESN